MILRRFNIPCTADYMSLVGGLLELIIFIHALFITWIYIAPLQGYYSETLPTLAKKSSFKARVECVRMNP